MGYLKTGGIGIVSGAVKAHNSSAADRMFEEFRAAGDHLSTSQQIRDTRFDTGKAGQPGGPYPGFAIRVMANPDGLRD